MLKTAARIIILGGIALMVAPEQIGTAVREISKGFGLILGGIAEMSLDSASDTVHHFAQEGWKHPTEGAIGWKLIDLVKGWFQ
ncbi:hypothetical protein D1872_51950 [compost metagenome]